MKSSSLTPTGNSSNQSENSSPTNKRKLTESSKNIQVEFAVNVNRPEDLKQIDHLLSEHGYRTVTSDFESKTIRLELETNRIISEQVKGVQHLQDFIEKETGFLAVIRGVGELAAAVSELRPSADSIRNGVNLHGVVRLSQLDNNLCYVDGSVGASYGDEQYKIPKFLSMAIHEFGNLQGDKYESIGKPMIDIVKEEQINDPNMSVSKILPNCNVAEMVGRSIALTGSSSKESKEATILSAGVVARASTVEKNKKQVCSCSGKTLWEERVDRKKSEQQGTGGGGGQ